jgi:hypothetical protein
MRNGFCLVLYVMVATVAIAAPLRLYFVDVERGQATLLVAPSGKSMLIDTGWPRPRRLGRGANRRGSETGGDLEA